MPLGIDKDWLGWGGKQRQVVPKSELDHSCLCRCLRGDVFKHKAIGALRFCRGSGSQGHPEYLGGAGRNLDYGRRDEQLVRVCVAVLAMDLLP